MALSTRRVDIASARRAPISREGSALTTIFHFPAAICVEKPDSHVYRSCFTTYFTCYLQSRLPLASADPLSCAFHCCARVRPAAPWPLGTKRPLSQIIEMAPTNVVLYIVRHGETDWNAEGRLQGQLDIPLNERGRQQAVAAGSWLVDALAKRKQHPAAIVSSDLSRAHETAELLAKAFADAGEHNIDVVKDARFRETNLGVWQTQKWSDIEGEQSSTVKQWRSSPDFAIEGGETTRARFHRVVSGLHDIMHTYGRRAASHGPTDTLAIVLVAHGGVIDDVGRFLYRVPFGKGTGLKKLNTSITIASFDWSHAHPEFIEGGWTDGFNPMTICPTLASMHVAKHPGPAPGHGGHGHMGRGREEFMEPPLSPWTLLKWGVVEHLHGLHDERPVETGTLASDTGALPGPPAVLGHARGSAAGMLPGDEAQDAEAAITSQQTPKVALDDVESA